MFYRLIRRIENGWDRFRANCQRFARGYSWGDTYDIFYWFIQTLEPMLRHYKKEHMGYPIGSTDEEWTEILDQMITHLHLMDEENVIEEVFDGDWSSKDVGKVQLEHKDKFFALFSEHFYDLWD